MTALVYRTQLTTTAPT